MKKSIFFWAFLTSTICTLNASLVSKQQPTQQQNLRNLNVSTIGLDNSARAIQFGFNITKTLLSNLINKNCTDAEYVNGVSKILVSMTNNIQLKLSNISAILMEMTAPVNLETMVQNEITTYANLFKKLNQNNTNSALLNIVNDFIKAADNTINVTIKDLYDYIKRNASGLLGLPLNTPECVCLDRAFEILDGNQCAVGNVLSGTIDPSGNQLQSSLLYELENALVSANSTCLKIFEQLNIFVQLGVSLNLSRCSSDFKQYLVSCYVAIFRAVVLKLSPLHSLTLQLNATELSGLLQNDLDLLADLNAKLSKPNVSNDDVFYVSERFPVYVRTILTRTFPAIYKYIGDHQNVSDNCVCISSASRTLLASAVPILAKLEGIVPDLIIEFLKIALILINLPSIKIYGSLVVQQ